MKLHACATSKLVIAVIATSCLHTSLAAGLGSRIPAHDSLAFRKGNGSLLKLTLQPRSSVNRGSSLDHWRQNREGLRRT